MNCDEECVPSSPIITNDLTNATIKRLGITDRFIDVAFLIFLSNRTRGEKLYIAVFMNVLRRVCTFFIWEIVREHLCSVILIMRYECLCEENHMICNMRD